MHSSQKECNSSMKNYNQGLLRVLVTLNLSFIYNLNVKELLGKVIFLLGKVIFYWARSFFLLGKVIFLLGKVVSPKKRPCPVKK